MRKYGMTLQQYNEMFAAQNGCCAICGKHQTEFVKGLAVDHDHATGAVRALLCVNCNLGVGYFKESVDLLGQAIAYVERFQETRTRPDSDPGARENSGQAESSSVH